jgi:phage gpG-like protein
MKEGFNFGQISKEIKNALKDLPKEIAVIVKDDAIINMYSSSFDNKSWAPRKDDEIHPLLIDSGTLLNDIRNSVNNGFSSGPIFNIVVDNPYSGVHNFGTNKIPQRQFMGESKGLNVKVKSFVDKKLTPLFEPKK